MESENQKNSTQKNAFYPNASVDVRPIQSFPDITHWFYMDANVDASELGKVMHEIGFECISYKDATMLFQNKERYVTYYTHSVYPQAMYSRYLPCSILVACKLDTLPPCFSWEHVICEPHQSFEASLLLL
jgi:hypothetical protein